MSRFDVHAGMRTPQALADDDALVVIDDPALSLFLADVRATAVNPPAPTGDLAVLLRDGFEPATAPASPAPRRPSVRRWASRAAVLTGPLGLKLASAAVAAAATIAGAAALGVLPDALAPWRQPPGPVIAVPAERDDGDRESAPKGPARIPAAPAGADVDGLGALQHGIERRAEAERRARADDRAAAKADAEAAGERRERDEDAADDRPDAAEDAADDRRDADEDAADDRRDANEDAADDRRDAADDAEEAAEDDADDAEDEADEREDAERRQADEEADAREDAADDAEDDADDDTDAQADADDDAPDAGEDAAEDAEEAADDADD